jgi:pimeloyl-ACP methyl ester carboxylesterase
MGKYNASCCGDGATGCAVGYACREKENDCIVSSEKNSDPLLHVLPRYRLCKAQDTENLHGLSVAPGALLAYYSSHGPIENITGSPDMALLIVHGANRNADDYFCSASAAVELQTTFSNVLLIAPRFYSEYDQRENLSFLFWKDDRDGPWRYGADAMGPTTISSYTALDELVQSIWMQFPNLRQMTIAGHSSGGQFVQRWTLLTSFWFTDRMKSVVANPSSYAYLTPFRFIRGDWNIPRDDGDCPHYNQWEWGLDEGGELEVPYRDYALRNASHVVARFQSRRVLYLAGNLDRCNVSTPGWCDSHGLETNCMDELQGSNRLERNVRYIASLRRLGIWKEHSRRVVQNVGHDHSLMFQSPEGLEALFETKVDYGEVPSNSQ